MPRSEGFRRLAFVTRFVHAGLRANIVGARAECVEDASDSTGLGSADCIRLIGVLDQDGLNGVDVDATEEGREEVLLAVVIEKGEGAIAALEAVELGGMRSNGWAVVVALAVVGKLDRPANEDELGELGGHLEGEFAIENRVEAVFGDYAGPEFEGRICGGCLGGVHVPLIPLVTGVKYLNLDVGVDRLVVGHAVGSHQLLGRDDVDAKGDLLAFPET